jgi:hypothetical protein
MFRDEGGPVPPSARVSGSPSGLVVLGVRLKVVRCRPKSQVEGSGAGEGTCGRRAVLQIEGVAVLASFHLHHELERIGSEDAEQCVRRSPGSRAPGRDPVVAGRSKRGHG